MIEIYQDKILPFFMKAIARPDIMEHRCEVLKNACGNVLEIGIGMGLNLDVYPNHITEITAIDPFIRKLPASRIAVKLYPDCAEKMSFADNSFDTVVSTFTFCSVSNLHITLREVSRVLKPEGKLLFLEHGKAKMRFLQQMQNVINPLYNIFACGCNINRDYKQFLTDAGFQIDQYDLYRAKIFPKFLAGYLYEGIAINEKYEVDI